VRHLVNHLLALGLVELRTNPLTHRRGHVVATARLRERLEEYAERMKAIVAWHRGGGLEASRTANSVYPQSRTLYAPRPTP